MITAGVHVIGADSASASAAHPHHHPAALDHRPWHCGSEFLGIDNLHVVTTLIFNCFNVTVSS